MRRTLLITSLAALTISRLPAQRNPEVESQGAPLPDLVANGKQSFGSNCSFCHGSSARGGAQGGPDLTQSSLVRGDRNGKQLGAFLQVGRPDKGMPAFHLPDDKVAAIAAFLHATVQAASKRREWGDEVLVGDAAAGKILFAGEGHCDGCHSVEGDLQKIGRKYATAVLQGRMILPIGHGGYPGFNPSEPPRIEATVTFSDGSTAKGKVSYISDYAITLVDGAGERRTFSRNGDLPKVDLRDPLQAHFDLQSRITDKQMHDLTAYLASLK